MEASPKLLFYRNQDQKKQKEQEKILKRLKADDKRYVTALQFMSRQQKRRVLGETTELCRDIQNLITTSIQMNVVVRSQIVVGTNSWYTTTRDLFTVPSNSLKNLSITKLWLLFSYFLLLIIQLGFSDCKCTGQQVIRGF